MTMTSTHRTVLTTLLLTGLLVPTFAGAAERVVLGEYFTNQY